MKSYSQVSAAAGLSRTEGHELQSGRPAAPPETPSCPGYTVWCEDMDETMRHTRTDLVDLLRVWSHSHTHHKVAAEHSRQH